MKKVEKEVMTKSWRDALTIPSWMVLEFTDAGMEEVYNGDDRESDDLRIAIEVSGGHKVLVPINGRVVIRENGAITIQILVQDKV